MTTINRAPYNALVDDDGSNLVGTVVNKALLASVFLDPIDVGFAALDTAIGGKEPTIGTLAVGKGGTGVATLAIHGVLVGNAASPVTVLAAAGAGTVLCGAAGADPAFSAAPAVTSVAASSFLAVGATPAASGAVRLDNNAFVTGRMTNSAVMLLLGLDASNQVTVGDQSNTATLRLHANTVRLIGGMDGITQMEMTGARLITTSTADLTLSTTTSGNIVLSPVGVVSVTSSLTIASGQALSCPAALKLNGTTELDFNINGTTVWYIGGAGTFIDAGAHQMQVGGPLVLGDMIQMTEMTAPSAPAANGLRIYGVDNGAGKTQLMVLFASGAAQQIAIQP